MVQTRRNCSRWLTSGCFRRNARGGIAWWLAKKLPSRRFHTIISSGFAANCVGLAEKSQCYIFAHRCRVDSECLFGLLRFAVGVEDGVDEAAGVFGRIFIGEDHGFID